MTMGEASSQRKAPLLALVILCGLLLLLPLVSSVPLSRSMSLSNNQASVSAPETPVQVVATTAEERNLDEVAARMVIEVNDYPGSGANNRHDPKSPGRA
ncbi:hypothetical protein E2562_013501 [Oryza meyeriana var. granulata]|uniref:Uncharacterized protein n=1 Tax=Oryza meyeriana var. granulata TaxID=110450 RepID=A0A6G1BVJ0_9ORYZ|nr:hypothetical protein E2562_013501 [Oryza meyeriana var. granulata]